MFRKTFVRSLPFVLAVVTAFAQGDMSKNAKELQKQASRLDREAGKDQETVFNSLSKQLNVPVDTLKTQQASTNWGPGQLFIANSLSSASGKGFDQVVQEFKSGKGWGEIAKENNINLGRVVSDLKRANKQAEEDRINQARADTRGSSARESGQEGSSGSRTSPGGSQKGTSMGQGGSHSGARGKR